MRILFNAAAIMLFGLLTPFCTRCRDCSSRSARGMGSFIGKFHDISAPYKGTQPAVHDLSRLFQSLLILHKFNKPSKSRLRACYPVRTEQGSWPRLHQCGAWSYLWDDAGVEAALDQLQLRPQHLLMLQALQVPPSAWLLCLARLTVQGRPWPPWATVGHLPLALSKERPLIDQAL